MDIVVLAGLIGQEEAWTSGLPRSLLPVPPPFTTIIQSLLTRLCSAFQGSRTICANGHTELMASRVARDFAPRCAVRFYEDPMPRGSAGCIKACEPYLDGDAIFITSGATWLEDDPLWMFQQHRAQGNALTVFCTRTSDLAEARSEGRLRPAGLYLCDRSVLDYIPPDGYHDIKEQLLPALHRAGLRVGAVVLSRQTFGVVDWSTYLHAIGRVLSDARLHACGYRQLAPDIWCGEDVEIAPQARVVGPVLLGNGCQVGDEAVVMGPTVLGSGSRVGSGSWLVRVIAPEGVKIPSGAIIADRLMSCARTEPRRERATCVDDGSREPQRPLERVAPMDDRSAKRRGASPGGGLRTRDPAKGDREGATAGRAGPGDFSG